MSYIKGNKLKLVKSKSKLKKIFTKKKSHNLEKKIKRKITVKGKSRNILKYNYKQKKHVNLEESQELSKERKVKKTKKKRKKRKQRCGMNTNTQQSSQLSAQQSAQESAQQSSQESAQESAQESELSTIININNTIQEGINNGTICGICYKIFNRRNKYKTKCNHYFHIDCLNKYCEKDNNECFCPTCTMPLFRPEDEDNFQPLTYDGRLDIQETPATYESILD